MAPSADLKQLVNQMPELDRRITKDKKVHILGKLTGPLWDNAEKVYDKILKGGRDSIVGVIDMLAAIDDGRDYKARYVLHAIAAYVCRPGKEKHRKAVIEAVSSQIGGDRPKAIQRFLVRQLQVCGDGRIAAALGKHLLDKDLYGPVAAALVAIGEGAAEQFRRALPKAKAKCRMTIVQSLGVVSDAASVEALKQAAGEDDAFVRIAAVWALANIGDAGSASVLIKAADAKMGSWERIQAAKACLLLAEKLKAAGKKADAAKLYTHLRDTRKDPSESYIRDVAQKALR
ncbi:MAG: HEAT repeat domain-containing protein [Phycisphaerae bacterium]|nr:HEAT repeat domain-containing protein [Phycisphaerae bacterium]